MACINSLLVDHRLAVFDQLLNWTLETSDEQNSQFTSPSDILISPLSSMCHPKRSLSKPTFFESNKFPNKAS